MNKTEIERIYRVSDLMVTAHAVERARLSRYSFLSDCGLFACSILLAVTVFADGRLLDAFLGTSYQLVIGVFSLTVFFWSLVASFLDWKIRAERHREAFQTYLELKFAASTLLGSQHSEEDAKNLTQRYNTITPTLISISEGRFNKLKQKHKLKVFISQYLDSHPGAWISFLRLKIWVNDNVAQVFGDVASSGAE